MNQLKQERNFWFLKTGENASKWDVIYNLGVAGIGWKKLGNLKQYKDIEEVEKALNKHYPSKSKNRQNDRLANWQFCNEIKVGDIIIAASGVDKILGYGEVYQEYFYDDKLDDEFASFIRVKWIKKGEWIKKGWAYKTLTMMTPYKELLAQTLEVIGFNNTFKEKEVEKIIFKDEEKILIKEAIEEFIKQVENCRKKSGTKNNAVSIRGVKPKLIQEKLKFLNQYGFLCHVSFGSTNLSLEPSISIFREDCLGEDFINGSKKTLQEGIYIYFYCLWEKASDKYKYRLKFGFARGDREAYRCPSVNQMEQDGVLDEQKEHSYENLTESMDKIIADFETILNVFKEYPRDGFKKEGQNKRDFINRNRDTPPLNQILYGPPGTGKTFSTIDKALEILNPEIVKETDNDMEVTDEEKRKKHKKAFDDYRERGQIEFVTFHQSYSYEDFIEGIRPKLDGGSKISYEIKNGIFKEICKRALENYNNSLKDPNILQKEMELREKIEIFLDDLIENQIEIKKSRKGSFFVSEYDKDRIYISTEDTRMDIVPSIDELVKILEAKKDFSSSKEMAKDVFGESNQQQRRTYLFQLFKHFKTFKTEKESKIENIDNTLKYYVLIIDEINRGNISKIFGELITLIEEDKRIGNDEKIEITLPYSQEKFGIPKNLYIIGTMNTADRSIASLDIALRRRFDFVEMMPDSSKLKEKEIEGVDLKEMLDRMNRKISCLYDREKMIGHTFFLGIENLQDLARVFQKKIIPLLQEYFYNDYERIKEILNDNNMITEMKLDEDYGTYCIASSNDEIWEKEETYKKIYQ